MKIENLWKPRPGAVAKTGSTPGRNEDVALPTDQSDIRLPEHTKSPATRNKKVPATVVKTPEVVFPPSAAVLPERLMMEGLEHLPGQHLLEGSPKTMNWKPMIRELLYPVQFDNQPGDGLDRVLEQVVADPDNTLSRDDYLKAIQSALESKEPLGALVGMPHPEETVRRYLEQVSQRLGQD